MLIFSRLEFELHVRSHSSQGVP